MPGICLCSLVLNEMEHLPFLYAQHRNWPKLAKWIFVEAADFVYAEANPYMVSKEGLSVDGTSEYLQELTRADDRVVYIPHGISKHQDRSQGKCEARSRYLQEADRVQPDLLFVLDADEYYLQKDQEIVTRLMYRYSTGATSFCFKHKHPWRPPTVVDQYGKFDLEVVGGFWEMPLCRGWKWFPSLRYAQNHNTPETPSGTSLDNRMKRFYREPNYPECIHLAFCSSYSSRTSKHRYYVQRGEGVSDRRGWYVASRAAWETWKVGDILPHNAIVQDYQGSIPECFRAEDNSCVRDS